MPRAEGSGSRHAALRPALAVIAAIAAGVIAWQLTPASPRLDDGLIALDSAQSLVAGSDPQYGSPPLTGVTSPPYVLGIAVLLRVGFPALIALRVASALGLAAFTAALWALARAVRLPIPAQIVCVVTVLSCHPIVVQATNGVETGWAMAGAVGLIAAAAAHRPFLAGPAAGLLPWLRPDLGLFAGGLLLVTLWRSPWKVRAWTAMLALASAVPWMLWLHTHTGVWIPQTMAAKAAFFAEGCWPLAEKSAMLAGALGNWFTVVLPVAIPAVTWLPRSPLGRIGLVLSALAIGVHGTILPGGLWQNDFRYLYAILVPWLAFGAALALQRGGSMTRVVVAGVVLANVVSIPYVSADQKLSLQRDGLARWISLNIESTETVLVQDAGMLAVFTRNPLVDLVGLKTPASIKVHQALTWPTCGARRAEAAAAIARSANAKYALFTADWDRIFELSAGLERNGVKVEEVATSFGEYRLFRLTSGSE